MLLEIDCWIQWCSTRTVQSIWECGNASVRFTRPENGDGPSAETGVVTSIECRRTGNAAPLPTGLDILGDAVCAMWHIKDNSLTDAAVIECDNTGCSYTVSNIFDRVAVSASVVVQLGKCYLHPGLEFVPELGL